MVNQQQAQAIVDRYLTSLTNSDLDGVMALYADDARVEDPVGSEPLQGRGPLTEFYAKAVDMVLSARGQGPVRAAGNELAFAFEIESEYQGQRLVMEIIDHFVLDEHLKIISMRAFWSDANMRPAKCS